jgi:biotin carboxyl carrier protein
MKERTAVVSGEHYTMNWNESQGTLEATVNGRQYRLHVRKLENGGFWFGWDGRSAEVIAVPRDEAYDVGINGHQVHVEFLESNKRLRRQGTGSHSGTVEVRAPMPGKIVRVLLGESEQVMARQGIVVIEAMKMQNEIRSPKAGRIVELTVSAGDAVGLGDLIARVE